MDILQGQGKPSPYETLKKFAGKTGIHELAMQRWVCFSATLSTTRMPGAMDDLNPADFTALQPYLDPVRVKRGLREKVLDDAPGLFPGGLVHLEDN